MAWDDGEHLGLGLGLGAETPQEVMLDARETERWGWERRMAVEGVSDALKNERRGLGDENGCGRGGLC